MNNEIPELKLDGAEETTELGEAAAAAQAAIEDLDTTVSSAMSELATLDFKELDTLPPEEANYLRNIKLT